MVLGPAPPLQDGTQRRKDKGETERKEGGSEVNMEGEGGMSESSDAGGLNV